MSPDLNAAKKQQPAHDESHYGDLATWALVIVGIGGVIAALKTLAIIKRQTKAIEQQGAALINSERAWVVVSKVSPPDLMWKIEGRDGSFNMLTFDIKNVGRTVARILAFRSNWRVVSRETALPAVPEYLPSDRDDLMPMHGRIMAPGEIIEGIVIVIYEPFDNEKFNRLQRGELIMWVYAYIEYADVAERKRRIQFCYRYTNPTEGLPTKYIVAGPRDYNAHT